MMNILNRQTLAFLTFCLIISSGSAFGFNLFKGKNTIWEKNNNVYFKYVEYKKSQFGNNNHPIKLDPQEITAALGPLQIRTNKTLTTKSKLQTAFGAKHTQTIGQYLAKGLSQAKPNQDVIFALERKVTRGVGLLPIGHFIAGRAFYKDGHLNIIIGDYDRPRDIGYEAANDPTHVGIVRYKFDHGKRSDHSAGFKHSFVLVNGIENKKVNNTKRNNWLVINVETASKAFVKQAKTAKKADLAKKRKELREILGAEEPEYREQLRRSAPVTRSAEDRLTTLNKLLDKGLISDKEFQQKRQQIIDSL